VDSEKNRIRKGKGDGMTPEQIQNWRKMLSGQFGPYAFIMPVEQIEKFRDRLQKQVDSIDDKEGEKS
jgi:hypothetical protein